MEADKGRQLTFLYGIPADVFDNDGPKRNYEGFDFKQDKNEKYRAQ